MADHEVTVGNIGTVYFGENHDLAMAKFNDYCELSRDNYGRVGGEPVCWMIDGVIHDEILGTLEEDCADPDTDSED